MNVLGIIGSMRKGNNTEALVRRVIDEMTSMLPDEGAASELVHTPDLNCHPCRVVCHDAHCSKKLYHCSIDDDVMRVLEKMMDADAVVLGAPHYFRAPPAGFHAMIERMQSMAFFYEATGHSHEGSPLVGKPCGLVAVAEYSNPHVILEYLHDFCLLLKMKPVELPTFPYLGVGGHGDLENDEIFHPFERAAELAAALVAVPCL
ncbi:NAD(P)H-dependent oxidoreductase [Candidatus Bipolaricaulota bacterium]|nr:NAD(P)H-dependent oxidoreductase [Candidatus Bipolaricaulota bacterium]